MDHCQDMWAGLGQDVWAGLGQDMWAWLGQDEWAGLGQGVWAGLGQYCGEQGGASATGWHRSTTALISPTLTPS